MEDILYIIVIIISALGILLSVIGSIWFYVEAFRQDVVWGFACLFIPFATLVFLFKYTERVLMPTGLSFLGIICLVAAQFMIKSI